MASAKATRLPKEKDPEMGLFDPTRSRSASPPSDTKVTVSQPSSRIVEETNLFPKNGMLGDLPRAILARGSRRTRKKKTKKAGRRKSRR